MFAEILIIQNPEGGAYWTGSIWLLRLTDENLFDNILYKWESNTTHTHTSLKTLVFLNPGCPK